MLLVDQDSNSRLPEEYHESNNICAYLYDLLTDLLTNESYDRYFKVSGFEFGEDVDVSTLESLKNGEIDILNWLKEQGRKTELQTILVKHITLAVLSDAVNFIYESLSTAQKGKVTVAYSLLRKPFTDELLIFEQLLHDPRDFIERFYHSGDITTYDPASKRNPPNHQEIINKTFEKIKASVISSDFIFRARYDKSYVPGINGITNQALHIVTNDPNYRTSSQNFNFVFSVLSEQKTYLKHYYTMVPALLVYTSSVVDEILLPYLPPDEYRVLTVSRVLKRLIALDMLLFKEDDKSVFSDLSEFLHGDCDACKEQYELTRNVFWDFFKTDTFTCPKCQEQSSLSIDHIEGLEMIVEALSNANMKFNSSDLSRVK